MKRIFLAVIPDPNLSPDDPNYKDNIIDFSSLVKQVVRTPLDKAAGADIVEIRRGVRVLDALDKEEGSILELEDADWEYLKRKVEKMTWVVVDRRFAQFYDDVMEATDEPRFPADRFQIEVKMP